MYLYQEGDSVFHSLHPVTKLALLILLISLPFLATTLPAILLLLVSYALLLLLAKGRRNFQRFWKLLLIFWCFTFLVWIFVPKLRHVPWSYANAALLATRIDCFVLSGLVFVTVTRIEEFTFGLTRLGIPYKGAFALSLGFRLVPLFYQNLQIIVAAQKSRGVDLDSGGMLTRARRYIPLFGILISYALRNVDLMAMSLEAKGFGFSPRRTFYLQPTFGWRDLLLLICGLAVVALFFL